MSSDEDDLSFWKSASLSSDPPAPSPLVPSPPASESYNRNISESRRPGFMDGGYGDGTSGDGPGLLLAEIFRLYGDGENGQKGQPAADTLELRHDMSPKLSDQYSKQFTVLVGLAALFIGTTVGYFIKSESNKLKDLRKERNSLKKQLKTAEKVDKPKFEKQINDLSTQIEKKETEIKSLKNTNAITKKKLAEAEDKEGILKAIEIFPKRYRTPVRTKVKAFFKQMGAFGTKAVKSSKNQYNNVMKYLNLTRKSSPSKGKSKPKTAANKSKTSTAMTAKNH